MNKIAVKELLYKHLISRKNVKFIYNDNIYIFFTRFYQNKIFLIFFYLKKMESLELFPI